MAAIFYTLATLKSRINDNERGATAVEYGIMVAAIAVAILAIVFFLGDEVAELFNEVNTELGAR